MKKIVTALLAIAGLIFSAKAQEASKMKGFHHRHVQHEMMMKELNLTATQQDQLKANRDSYREQWKALNNNEAITVKESRDKKEALRKEQREKMMSILTPEQKTTMQQIKKDREAKHQAMAAKQLDKIKSTLNLSDDQVAKIKAGTLDIHAKAKVIRENDQLTRVEKKEQLIALKQQTKDNLKSVLTPEQITKLDEIKKIRMEKRQAR
jgi:Spy/CpxP family protein refolding chaperone